VSLSTGRARGPRAPRAAIEPLGAAERKREREFWSRLTTGWERWEPVLQHSLSGVDPALFRALDLEPGHQVADLACGIGDPALAIARWVEPRGRVLGLDISVPMLAVARLRARMLGLRNVRFRRGDLSRFDPGRRRFDGVVSRFGLMFADDVPEALERMRRSLKPGGRIAVAVWGPLERNPAHRLRSEAVRPFLERPLPDPEKSAHPLRLGRPGLLPRLLRRAGFVAVRAEAAPTCGVYPSLEDFVRVQTEVALSETYCRLGRADRHRLCERLRRRFARFRRGEALRVPGFAWVISGARPSQARARAIPAGR
jgi:SAM-dependent methyltransferase